MACCICKRNVDPEYSPILTVGGFGNPRYLCEECAALLDTVMQGDDVVQIKSAMSGIAELVTKSSVDDEVTLQTLDSILSEAKERADMIERGEYDASEHVDEGVVDDDVPEELRESEEDKALDAEEEKQRTRMDSVFTWISIGFFAAATVALVLYFVFR